MKTQLGRAIAERITSDCTIGVGTGSTVDAVLEEIGKHLQQKNYTVQALVTSLPTALRCKEVGIHVLDPNSFDGTLAWGFDGTDEVDDRLRLIKGAGGALLLEKIVAARCSHWIIVADERKKVKKLGEKFPVPVEVIPEARTFVMKELHHLGAQEITLRDGKPGKFGPVVTEKGNILFDVKFSNIGDEMERALKSIPGVVESGLFLSWAHEVLLSTPDGLSILTRS